MRDILDPVIVVTLLLGWVAFGLQGERKKRGDRDMKFITWHSSDGCCSSFSRTQMIVAWAAFKCWTFLERNGDLLLTSLYVSSVREG
jgi:hypothetical protein